MARSLLEKFRTHTESLVDLCVDCGKVGIDGDYATISPEIDKILFKFCGYYQTQCPDCDGIDRYPISFYKGKKEWH